MLSRRQIRLILLQFPSDTAAVKLTLPGGLNNGQKKKHGYDNSKHEERQPEVTEGSVVWCWGQRIAFIPVAAHRETSCMFEAIETCLHDDDPVASTQSGNDGKCSRVPRILTRWNLKSHSCRDGGPLPPISRPKRSSSVRPQAGNLSPPWEFVKAGFPAGFLFRPVARCATRRRYRPGVTRSRNFLQGL